jgi:hypothetical protein
MRQLAGVKMVAAFWSRRIEIRVERILVSSCAKAIEG